MAKYDVRVRYAFEGTYTVVAEDHDEARQMVSEGCGRGRGTPTHRFFLWLNETGKGLRHPLILAGELRNYERISLKRYDNCFKHTA